MKLYKVAAQVIFENIVTMAAENRQEARKKTEKEIAERKYEMFNFEGVDMDEIQPTIASIWADETEQEEMEPLKDSDTCPSCGAFTGGKACGKCEN